MRLLGRPLVVALVLLTPAAAAAQPTLASAVAGQPARCDDRIVTAINIQTLPPFPEGIFRRWRALSDLVRSLHVTTHPEVVRRFLTFEVGEGCRPIDLSESERILRVQPFIADAHVTVVDDGAGGLRAEVVTRDEVALQGSLNMRSLTNVRGVSLGNSNIAGGATSVIGRWEQGGHYRDVFGVRLIDYQLLNRAMQAEVNAVRYKVGGEWFTQLSHPFFTDLQRVAWRASVGESRIYYPFVRQADTHPAIGVHWTYRDLGGVFRLGLPGRLSLFGASFSREESTPDTMAVIIGPTGLRDTLDPAIGGYPRHRSARVNALWGVRNIRFLRVRGLDALDGVQDVRRGFQLGTLAGRSLQVLGSRDDDIFLAADLYAGGGTQRVFAALQVMGEGRQDYNINRWDDIFATGRGAIYVKPSTWHTMVFSGEYSAGWRQLVPFQLTLGHAEAGVRGYRDAPFGGAQRLVVRAEERWFWGRPWRLADLGMALFTDGGRVWAGDSPHGVDTPWKMSVGAGLLAGIPPRSKRLWRLDAAFPISDGAIRDWELRISNRDFSRVFWREPADIRRSRGRALPTSVFNWP